MDVSVIFTTYNSPDWLEKALWGWEAQTYSDFEIVVADDGSGRETRERIDRLREESGMRIEHVWQEDEGFRKCRILNKAVLAARGEYLIFSDGDCIPRDDFVATHLRHAQPGRYLSGGYFKLPEEVSRLLSADDIVNGRPFDSAWLKSQGVTLDLHALKFVRGWVSVVLNALTPTKPTWNGHNSSGWKRDILAVNGFDERMSYGGQDRELGYRLVNAGVRPRQIRYSTVCVHLAHGRPYATDEARAQSRAIMQETLRTGRAWTAYGIKQSETTEAPEVRG